jgi:hypothetical protein
MQASDEVWAVYQAHTELHYRSHDSMVRRQKVQLKGPQAFP